MATCHLFFVFYCEGKLVSVVWGGEDIFILPAVLDLCTLRVDCACMFMSTFPCIYAGCVCTMCVYVCVCYMCMCVCVCVYVNVYTRVQALPAHIPGYSTGTMRAGDLILAINGESLHMKTVPEAIQMLQRSGDVVTLKICKSIKKTSEGGRRGREWRGEEREWRGREWRGERGSGKERRREGRMRRGGGRDGVRGRRR